MHHYIHFIIDIKFWSLIPTGLKKTAEVTSRSINGSSNTGDAFETAW